MRPQRRSAKPVRGAGRKRDGGQKFSRRLIEAFQLIKIGNVDMTQSRPFPSGRAATSNTALDKLELVILPSVSSFVMKPLLSLASGSPLMLEMK